MNLYQRICDKERKPLVTDTLGYGYLAENKTCAKQ